MNVLRHLISLVLLVSLCSCVSWRDAAALKAGYQRKAVAESIIERVKQEYAVKLATNQHQIELAQETFVKGLKDNAQFAADRLYGADFTFQTLLRPDRAHIIMDNKVNEARAVLPSPSVAAMAKENAEVKRLLDETLTSLDQLKTEHDKAVADAKVVTDRAVKAEVDLAAAKQAKLDIEAAKARELEAKQNELNKANNAVIDAEHARGDDAKAKQALMTKLSVGCGLLAAACIAGAIFSPLLKLQFAAAGVIFGVAAVGIWYLTPLIVGGIAVTMVLGVVGWAALNHNKEAGVSTDLMRAIQRIKENAPEAYAIAVKPELDEANTKYVTKDGIITKVPDDKRVAFIDARLAAVGDK